MQYYITGLLVYFGIDVLSALSLNLQYAYAGVPNFAYIVFVAAGAYIAGVTSLGPPGPLASQHYILGASLPFPLPLVAAALAGGLLSLVLGPFILRNLREDYQAAVMFILAIIASQIISTATNVFNGANGISDIPRPLHGAAGLNGMTYNWAYVVWVWVICGITYLVVERLARSGWGRALRAVRDQHVAAASIGLNPTALRIQVFVFGGVIAGLAGGLLVEFIGAWSPSGWGYAETFIFFAAIIVGGLENNRGAVLGTLLIPIIFTELPAFLPAVGYPGLVDSLEWVVIGAIWIGFLGFRPRGLVPARRNTLARLGRLRTLKPGPLPHPPA